MLGEYQDFANLWIGHPDFTGENQSFHLHSVLFS